MPEATFPREEFRPASPLVGFKLMDDIDFDSWLEIDEVMGVSEFTLTWSLLVPKLLMEGG